MSTRFLVLLGAGALAISTSAAAQGADGMPTLVIPRLTAAPRLEAFVTMRPSAADIGAMVRVDRFTQRWPDDGKPERFRTVAYLGYTDDALHIIYVAFDPEPKALRAHLLRREEVFTVNDDEVEVRLDTYGDRRQSYYLVSNPLGVQLDAAWPEAGGQYDEAFDLVWHSRGQRTDEGFVVLMSIPFRSLRFKPGDQPWGIYLGRWIPRTGEWSFWPPISIRQQSYLSQMARLDGIRNVSRGRGIQLIPYASMRAFHALDRRDPAHPGFITDASDPSAGLDAKFIVRDSLVVDATINPDFSQVETDAPQITANQRFEVFFPEKRPFFIENAGFLQTPINLMFTRRIADPRFGGKLSGRAGPWAIGVLAADDEAPGKRAAITDRAYGSRARVAAVRASRNASGQSNVGGIFSYRDQPGRSNAVSGVDVRLPFATVWTANAQAAFSIVNVPASSTTGSGYFVALARNGRTLSTRTQLDGRSPDFTTDLGFVPRLDVHQFTQTLNYTLRPAKAITDWGPSLQLERAWAFDGTPLDWRARPGLTVNMRQSTSLSVAAEVSHVTLRPGDAPNVAAPMGFRADGWTISGGSAPRPQLTFSAELTGGSAINFTPAAARPPDTGPYRRMRLSIGLRPLTPLRIENVWLYASLDAAGRRAFTSNIVRTQWAWQFSREWSLRFIGQYDETTADPLRSSLVPRRNLNGDVLLTRLINPWTAVYVGYNGNGQNIELVEDAAGPRLQRSGTLTRDAWQLFVKASYLWRR